MNMQNIQILFLLFDSVIKLAPWRIVTETMQRIGYGARESLARSLGVVAIVGAVLYVFPPTSIVGAVLPAGYFWWRDGVVYADRHSAGEPHPVRVLARADGVGRAVVVSQEPARVDAAELIA
jgi:DoxX-like family